MAKRLDDIIKEMNEEKASATRHVTSFSRSGFNKFVTAYINTPDIETTVMKTRNGETVTETVAPVREFRKMIKSVLEDKGVDKQESAAMENDYMFSESQMKHFYPFAEDVIMRYMQQDKKFDFATRQNVSGGILIKHVPESVSSYKAPRSGATGKVKKAAHDVIKVKNKVSPWNKVKIPD
jgi:hypothetical protein